MEVAAIQICTDLTNKHNNFQKVENIMEQIGKVDLILLPEVWSVGWNCKEFQKKAEELIGSETLEFLSKLAKKCHTNIIGGSLILKKDNNYYNVCPVINRNGELIALYEKNHLFGYYGADENKYIVKGNQPVLVNIEGIKIGLTICYDIRFPEIYRAYRKAGADVLINCAAWASTKPIPWEMMTKSRAIENQCYMIAVNQYGPFNKNETNLGHSRIIDYNGNVISEILKGEGFIKSKLDFKSMYEFRDKCTILKDIKENYEVKKYE